MAEYAIRHKVTGHIYEEIAFRTEEAAWRKIGMEPEPELYEVVGQ